MKLMFELRFVGNTELLASVSSCACKILFFDSLEIMDWIVSISKYELALLFNTIMTERVRFSTQF